MGYKTYTCPIAKDCGGCEWLAVPYEIQLKRKQAQMEELFSQFSCGVQPILGMDEPKEYRAKVMTPFKRGPKGKVLHGMYRPGTHDIVCCHQCLVEYPQAQPIIATIARLCSRLGIDPYDEDSGRGLLRHAVIRVSNETGESMVTLVINRKEFPRKREFVSALRQEHPDISTVVFNVNTRNTNAVLGNSSSTAYGQGWLEDSLCGCTFHIPATAFYQTNPRQTEVLYGEAVRLGKPLAGETILDAYCGIGTIGIVAAKKARQPKAKKGRKPAAPRPVRLIGVESVEAAAKVAAENARINQVKNAQFVAGDAGAFLRECLEEVDLVFMDPPRSGASQDFIDGLRQSRPQRIVYVSCNPVTQLRDLELLSDLYQVKCIVPVDMFPHTKHVETVVLLRLKAQKDEMAEVPSGERANS